MLFFFNTQYSTEGQKSEEQSILSQAQREGVTTDDILLLMTSR